MFKLKRRPWLKPLKDTGTWNGMQDWIRGFDTLGEAWSVCQRGDWMLDILKHSLDGFSVPDGESSIFHNKRLISASYKCARHLLQHLPDAPVPTSIINSVAADDINIDDILKAHGIYDTLSELMNLSHDSNPFCLHNACMQISFILSSGSMEHKFETAKSTELQLLKECADIIRNDYPTPPIMTWKELGTWRNTLTDSERDKLLI